MHLRKLFINLMNQVANRNQGYEVTEDEVQMPLDVFKAKYAGPVGYPEYVPFTSFHSFA